MAEDQPFRGSGLRKQLLLAVELCDEADVSDDDRLKQERLFEAARSYLIGAIDNVERRLLAVRQGR